jgi:hypothetical protein
VSRSYPSSWEYRRKAYYRLLRYPTVVESACEIYQEVKVIYSGLHALFLMVQSLIAFAINFHSKKAGWKFSTQDTASFASGPIRQKWYQRSIDCKHLGIQWLGIYLQQGMRGTSRKQAWATLQDWHELLPRHFEPHCSAVLIHLSGIYVKSFPYRSL